MKTKIYILVLVFLAMMGFLNAQKDSTHLHVKLSDFNFYFWNAYADKLHLTAKERNEFISSHQQTHQSPPQNYTGQKTPDAQAASRSANYNNILAGGCTNIDFESGNMSGWAPFSGYNPLYSANPTGCCMNSGGQQTIMTGAGLDPAGGFPVVAPGGSFSLRLGNSLTGGQADRIEQTFQVTSANANFTYRYAVVMQDPGHVVAQQPSFQVEMLDSLGGQIPCTFYNVAAGNNIPGFINSTTMTDVVYKPWSSVVADLTALIGQNITIRFTTYDCSLGGHFGYAYIDGSCLSFITGSNDTICAGTQKTYCAPNGFLTTTWNGPGVVNNTNQCLTASAPGIYTCQTVLIPGCPGPDFTYTLSNYPQPVAAFTATATGNCSPQYTFNNNSTISSGSIAAYSWSFGNTTSSLQNPVHNFPAAGNYSVSLSATSANGCSATATQTITVYPFPVAAFTAPAGCMLTNVLFNNTSSISLGTISNYTWNLGNGNVSNLQQPTATYTNGGNYIVSLSVSSNQNCVSTQSASLVVYQKPTASFNDATLNNCAQQYTFTNTSSIGSGSITAYNWNFGGNNSTLQNPVNVFPAAGNYSVSMIATSNNNCKDTAYKNIAIYPYPVVEFSAQAVCLNSIVNFTNTSTIAMGNITGYNWNFGNGVTSQAINPALNYIAAGNYIVNLSATSNQNCVSTTTSNLLIYALPTASISVANLCKGNISAFANNAAVANSSVLSYAWNFGDGNTSSAALPYNQYANSGTYPVSLTVTSNQNCLTSVYANVTIHPLPVVSYNVANMCLGNTTSFTNNSSINAGSISSYTWNFGNNNSSNLTNTSMVYSGSGNYIVSLSAKSNQNCVATFTSNLVIHPVPAVSFTTGNMCLGDTTLFTGNYSISSGSIVSFSWNFGDGTTSSAVYPSHPYQNYGNKVVTLTALSNQNCPTTFTSQISIHPRPIVTFTAGNVCHGNATNFNNSSNIPAGSITGWNWSFGNGQTGTGVINPTYSYNLPGTYNVTLQATSNKNCSSSATKIVKVFAAPTASFVAQNVCHGQASAFNNKSSIDNPEQVVSYNWLLGNGSGSNFVNPVITYSAAGNYNVKLTVTSGNNCSASFISPYSIYHLPQVAFIPTSACKDQATQFTNQTVLNSGALLKSRWDFENDGVWDDTVNINPVRTYPNHGSYSCKLEVESSFQCRSAKTNNVIVHANPAADFNTKAVCFGDKTIFTNRSTSLDGAISSYQWDFNGDNVIDNVLPNATITYSANGTYLVRLEVQTQFGCTNVKSASGHINPMPTALFSSKNNKGCPRLDVNFDNASFIPSGAITHYQWNFGDGAPLDMNKNPLHGFDVGSYNVTLTVVSDSGCVHSLTQPGFVSVYPKPVAGFAVSPDEIDENEPLVNVRSTATDAAFTSYYMNDGMRVNTSDFTHSFKGIEQTKPMLVQIVKNSFGCADTLYEMIKVKPAFVIYIPNTFTPNGDGRNDAFQAKGVGISKFSMQIFDRWGHQLFESADIMNAWDGTTKGGEEPIMQDVYVWKAQVVDLTNKLHDMSGHVSLIR